MAVVVLGGRAVDGLDLVIGFLVEHDPVGRWRPARSIFLCCGEWVSFRPRNAGIRSRPLPATRMEVLAWGRACCPFAHAGSWGRQSCTWKWAGNGFRRWSCEPCPRGCRAPPCGTLVAPSRECTLVRSRRCLHWLGRELFHSLLLLLEHFAAL